MAIEFVVWKNPTMFLSYQELPKVYEDKAYNDNREIYLTSPLRYRMKVEILKQNDGPIIVKGDKWIRFAEENFDTNVAVLHFVEEGDDSFYVTGYCQNETKAIGYHGIFIKRRVTYNVELSRVSVGGQGGPYAYKIDDDSWETIKDELGNTSSFLGYRLMHTYYKALMKHKSYQELTTMKMNFHSEKPDRKNHLNATGQWKLFVEKCNFEYSKLIRFKFMYMEDDKEAEDDEAQEYPVFHLC
ncbi:hypothetical protein Tco_0827523 [Tanacetum coccineum]